ncbi:unnamed protein product [marine sediment metagenome]|uniref:Toprim domain-containing protein n=1 Tax=marine sediment metagenome TaxID=412755 RepID=X0SR33_9ZZZZ
MRIDQITGIYHCFSCGFAGNVFELYGLPANLLAIKRENLRRKMTEKRLNSAGLEMPKGYTPYTEEYRGISAETIVKFQAFTHPDKQFIDRIVFPLTDMSGLIYAFHGRDLTNMLKAKYLTYPPKTALSLYPLIARPYMNSIILVEGIVDALNLWDKGLNNVVCSFGTDSMSKNKLILLKMMGAQELVLLFDNDDNEAGQKAALKVQKLCENNDMPVRNITISEGDPGDMSSEKVYRLKKYLYSET